TRWYGQGIWPWPPWPTACSRRGKPDSPECSCDVPPLAVMAKWDAQSCAQGHRCLASAPPRSWSLSSAKADDPVRLQPAPWDLDRPLSRAMTGSAEGPKTEKAIQPTPCRFVVDSLLMQARQIALSRTSSSAA